MSIYLSRSTDQALFKMFHNFLRTVQVFYFMKILHFAANVDLPSAELQREINSINSAQSLWTASKNYLSELNDDEIKNRLGLKLLRKRVLPKVHQKETGHIVAGIEMPKNFDARKTWSNCSVIKKIRDQSVCGSCWAMSVATAYSDRYCIASNQTIDKEFSVEDLLRCCGKCKEGGEKGNGCNGGYVDEAWSYLSGYGIVTGGVYNSNNGCIPYSIEPCTSTKNQKCPNNVKSEPCRKKCSNKEYRIKYQNDKHFASSNYAIADDEKERQMHIMKYGPCTAVFRVYRDFLNYAKGIYFHTYGKFLGLHAVRIIGWGTENNQPYWLAANSWNTSWGEEGTFRIHRTMNGCDFSDFMGSVPKLK